MSVFAPLEHRTKIRIRSICVLLGTGHQHRRHHVHFNFKTQDLDLEPDLAQAMLGSEQPYLAEAISFSRSQIMRVFSDITSSRGLPSRRKVNSVVAISVFCSNEAPLALTLKRV